MTHHAGATSAWADRLLALALAGLALIEIWVEPIFQSGLPGPRVAVSALALLGTLPLAWRRTYPLTALGVITVGLLGVGLVGERDQAGFELFLALLVAAYSVAVHCARRDVVIGAALVFAAGGAYEALTFSDTDVAADIAVPFLLLGAALLAGAEVRRHRGRATGLAERVSLLAEERDRQAEAAAAEERGRIARELHDAVAHSVGLSVMHVGAARLLLAEDPERSRELMRTAEARGREALAEMRRMLGILRSDEGEPLAPVASLRQLDALVEHLGAAGLEVELNTEGSPVRLPPGLDLSAYRIVQEALTNALRHGSEPRASATLAYLDRELVIVVTNPTASRHGGERAVGHGLVGIKERATLFGGAVSLGARDGEWRVEARLPLEAGAE